MFNSRSLTLCLVTWMSGSSGFLVPSARGLPARKRHALWSSESGKSLEIAKTVADALSMRFAWTVAAGAALGACFPHFVARHVLAGDSSLPIALSIAMFCAGSGLSLNEVSAAVVRRPKALVGGVAAQFCVMPLLAKTASAWLVSEPELAAGLLLVGCCPGGAASNIVTLLARGDVGLSIAMTATSTMCAGVLTPLLTSRLSASAIALEKVPADLLYRPLVQTLIFPSLIGVAFNQTANALRLDTIADVVRFVSPAFSSVLIAAIVCRVIANALLAPKLALGLTFKLCAALLFLHSAGFALGYIVARVLLRLRDEQACRAISIEVGMQNSALAVVLAATVFPAESVSSAALPGALSACWHSILGGFLASRWRRSDFRSMAVPATAKERI